eukprot:4395995-Prymnesium_polylepis.2
MREEARLKDAAEVVTVEADVHEPLAAADGGDSVREHLRAGAGARALGVGASLPQRAGSVDTAPWRRLAVVPLAVQCAVHVALCDSLLARPLTRALSHARALALSLSRAPASARRAP